MVVELANPNNATAETVVIIAQHGTVTTRAVTDGHRRTLSEITPDDGDTDTCVRQQVDLLTKSGFHVID